MTTCDAEKLAHYVRSLSFKFYETIDGNYDHIGATVADAVLQANNNYSTHVKPRVNWLLERYPDARTTRIVQPFIRRLRALNEPIDTVFKYSISLLSPSGLGYRKPSRLHVSER